MASLEEMAQPALDDEHFVQEEEDLAEPIELEKMSSHYLLQLS